MSHRKKMTWWLYFITSIRTANPLQATWCDFYNKLLLCQTYFFIKALSVPHLTQGCAVCHPNRACPSVPSHLLSVVLTMAEPIMLRRDGWQLFVDSMPRLISSVCLFWCQHSAGSVGESACLCFKAYPWHRDTDTTKQLVFFWHDWPIWIDHQLLNPLEKLSAWVFFISVFKITTRGWNSNEIKLLNSTKRIFKLYA